MGRASFLCVLLPAACILGWAVARRPFDPSWFWFLKGTRTFANDALGVKSSLDHGLQQLVKDLHYYATDVAYICFGLPIAFVPLGAIRAFKREGVAFFAVHLAVLAFITYVWIQRGSLGLLRHFMVLVPFYATLAAHGVVLVGDALGAGLRRVRAPPAFARLLKGGVIAGIAASCACVTYRETDLWMTDWRAKTRFLWPDRYGVAAYLRSLPSQTLIYCDEPSIEVFSNLDRRRFDRYPIGSDQAATRRITDSAALRGEVYVATWSDKLTALRKVATVVYRPPGSPLNDDEGLVVLRVVKR
ncbi:MAG: hypothetical protein NVS3B20_04710 [Polyangiales bacterium]